jgi:hypothetical protein
MPLTASQQMNMADAKAMLTTVANQGHAGAQSNLGVMHRDVAQGFLEI